jgi:hypothetical protein
MKFGMKCFTCGLGFDPTDAHAEIWCDGENVVTLCPTCTVASDTRINLQMRGAGARYSGMAGEVDDQGLGHTVSDPDGDTFIWDALKKMQERADQFRKRGRRAA